MSHVLVFKLWGLGKMLGAMRNSGRWSEIDKVILPDIISWDIVSKNILSIRGVKLLLTLVD